jgi:hypothetical protein
MLKDRLRRVKTAPGSEVLAFRIGFVKTLLYTALKVSYCRQDTSHHLYIVYTC